MRTIYRVAIASLMAAGCAGSDGTSSDDGLDTDTETDDKVHPNVPEEYQLFWNTEGCETQDGQDGANVYWLSTDAQAAPNGTFTATERWYWFFPEPGWASDCIDTWTIEGRFETFDYGQLNCSQCEEAFRYTRTLTDQQCSITYYSLFDLEEDEAPDEEIYDGYLLTDTMGPFGNLNERTLLVNGNRHPTGGYSMNPNYAWGTWTPANADDPQPGEGGDYTWLGEGCIGTK